MHGPGREKFWVGGQGGRGIWQMQNRAGFRRKGLVLCVVELVQEELVEEFAAHAVVVDVVPEVENVDLSVCICAVLNGNLREQGDNFPARLRGKITEPGVDIEGELLLE